MSNARCAALVLLLSLGADGLRHPLLGLRTTRAPHGNALAPLRRVVVGKVSVSCRRPAWATNTYIPGEAPHSKRWTAIPRKTVPGQQGDACWCAGCLASHLYLRSMGRGQGGGKETVGLATTDVGRDKTRVNGATDEKEGTPISASDGDKIADAMISALKGYKAFISPLLPPSCRFLPTCSIYSMQAIREFGPSKGAILTAWRLIRCNPVHWANGGRGYDPPAWPPVSYNYASDAAALKEELASVLQDLEESARERGGRD